MQLMYVDTWVSLNVWFNIVMDIFSFDIVWEKLTQVELVSKMLHIFIQTADTV